MYLTLAGRVCGQAIAVKRLRPTSIMPATRGGPPDHGLTGRHHRLDGGTVIARHKIRPRKLHPSHHRRTIRWSLRPRPPSSRRAKRRGSQADVDVHLASADFSEQFACLLRRDFRRSRVRRDEVREAGRGVGLVPQNEQSGTVDLQHAVERRESTLQIGLRRLVITRESGLRDGGKG